MRSGQLTLNQYDTDKISSGYLYWYDRFLQHLVDRETKLLEIGVDKGGSLLLWRDYFPKGTIAGIDVRAPVSIIGEERIHFFSGSQEDTTRLSEVAKHVAPDGFDVIIDDASHIAELTRVTFWHLFTNHLKPSGLYSIEDWGTGYWDGWPDGQSCNALLSLHSTAERGGPLYGLRTAPDCPSHSHGMVGFIKELIDEQGAADLTRMRPGGSPVRSSVFESIAVVPGVVFVTKRREQ